MMTVPAHSVENGHRLAEVGAARMGEKKQSCVAEEGKKTQPRAEEGEKTQPRAAGVGATRRAGIASTSARAATSGARRGGAMMTASPPEEGGRGKTAVRCDAAAAPPKGGAIGARAGRPTPAEEAVRAAAPLLVRDRCPRSRPPQAGATGDPCRRRQEVRAAGRGGPRRRPCRAARPRTTLGSPGFRC